MTEPGRGGRIGLGRVAVAGEALVDGLPSRSPDGESVLELRPGGSPYNVAISLARLGVPVSFHGAVGSDDDGQVLRDHAEGSGVDLSHLRISDAATMRAVAMVDGRGDAAYRFNLPDCAPMRWRPLRDELADVPTLLHVGSIASWLSPAAEAIADLVEDALRRHVPISVDPNLRPALLSTRDARVHAARRIDDLVRLAAVIKVSAADLRWLHPDVEPSAVAAAWAAHSPGLVVITDGPNAATAFLDGRLVAHRPARPVAVLDTIGAGDAFMSGLLAGLMSRGAVHASGIRSLAGDAQEMADLLDDAHAAAASACERIGAT